MKETDKEVIRKKLDLLNTIWVDYFFSYPYFENKVKFTEEEKTNYVGVLFGYFRDSLDIVFSEPPKQFNSYVEKFSFQIALLQSIYVQQDLTEELLRVFKTGIERNKLNEDENFSINRQIRNELIGHPISRDKNKNLISSTVFGYEKSGNSIQYLKYEFPDEKNVVQIVEINDVLERHNTFLNTYLDKLLNVSFPKLKNFKKEVLDVLNILLSQSNNDNVIRFYEIHFSLKFERENEITLTELKELPTKKLHLRYIHSFNIYIDYINDFCKDSIERIEKILNEKFIQSTSDSSLESQLIFPKITFVESDNRDETNSFFKRKNYNYELGKLISKRNLSDFDFYASSICDENANDDTIIQEIEHLRKKLNNKMEYICGWNYLSYLLSNKLNKITCI